MKTANLMEVVELFELLRQLPEEKLREFYLMIKGAALVAEMDKSA